jgi:hypothetical protein
MENPMRARVCGVRKLLFPLNSIFSLSVILLTLTLPGLAAPGKKSGPPASATPASQGSASIRSAVAASSHPLVARYTVTGSPGFSFYVEFGENPAQLNRRTSSVNISGGTGSVLVAGMRQFTTYYMRAVVTLPGGRVWRDQGHEFTTGGLPETRRPTISVEQPTPGFEPQAGVELLCRVFSQAGEVQAVVTDLQGNVIWYYDDPKAIGPTGYPFPIRQLSNGDFLINFGGLGLLREVDLEGKTVRELNTAVLQQQLEAMGYHSDVGFTIHHDVLPLPNGHILLLINFTKNYEDLNGTPGTSPVIVDGVVDLDPNWNPVWTWSGADHLDISGVDIPGDFGTEDWTHGNALAYLPDGNVLLSSRHLNELVKIDYRDGQGNGDVLWRLGVDRDFTLLNGGPADWFYGQHNPTVIGSNGSVLTLGVFDNGNFRRDDAGQKCPSNGEACYSRAAIFEVDQSAMSARLVWQHKSNLFGNFIGSTQLLANGNVQYDVGTNGGGPVANIFEVTGSLVPEIVWHMQVQNGFVYRATRVDSLYPGVQW